MGLNYKIDSFDIAGFEIEYEQYRTKPLDSVCGEARVYKSYPIVYILYNNSKIYIGESSRFLKRVKEHSNIIKREKLKQLLIKENIDVKDCKNLLEVKNKLCQ